jgi:hypothetical protein
MGNPTVSLSYTPRSDATPEAEISALANVYRFVLDCHAKKRGRLLDKSGPNDGKERSVDDSTARTIIQE